MQVASIECQIAQAQLRRYLTGEDMPTGVVNELETHLRNCPDCMSAAQTLRESLKGVLQSKITGKPLPQPVAQPKPQVRTQFLQQPEPQPVTQAVVQEREARPADVFDQPDSDFKHKAPKKRSNTKTLLYSVGLAVILVLMSTVFKDPTALFGPKASSITPDTPKATEKQETAAKPETNQAEPAPTEPETTTVEPPTQDPVATAQPTTDTQTQQPTNQQPLKTDGLIVADGVTGTTVVKKDPPKSEPKPQPRPPRKSAPQKKQSSGSGVGTIKVYPPEK